MALWGTADAVYATGTIAVDLANKTITGTNSTFTSAAPGDVISVGVGNTFGEAVIAAVASDTSLTISSTQHLSETVSGLVGLAYTISQKPKSTLSDTHYGSDGIFGIDPGETAYASNTAYAVSHSGWVGINTYTDQHGTLRVKSEVLVAMSGISSGTAAAGVYGDAADNNFGVDPATGKTVYRDA